MFFTQIALVAAIAAASPAVAQDDLYTKILEAQQHLTAEADPAPASADSWVELAIWCQGGETRYFLMTEWGANSSGYTVYHPQKLNGLNTAYEVPGCTTLALKRSMLSESGTYEWDVYTPLTRGINTPDMRKRGLTYLTDVLCATAKDELRTEAVYSRAYPGQLIVDVFPSCRTLANMALNEQMDPGLVKVLGASVLLDRELTTIAANGANAYNRADSPKMHALGLFQIMPRTYALLATAYPSAELPADAKKGARNHVSAAKMAFLHFDWTAWYFSAKLRAKVMKYGMEYATPQLAAAYNGGPGALLSVCKLVKKRHHHRGKLVCRSRERPETVEYRQKSNKIERELVTREAST